MVSWQTVRDMGLNLFKKRNRSRTLWVGGSVTFLSVLTYIILLTGVTVTTSGDIYCSEECISYVNLTSTYWRICFADEFDLIKTDPSGIEVEVYVPTRGKGNWRPLDITKDCIERKNKYNYLPNRFKIVGHKPSSLTVKWWSDSMKVPDPLWIGEDSIELKQECIKYRDKVTTVVDKTVEVWNDKNNSFYSTTLYKEKIVKVCVEYNDFIYLEDKKIDVDKLDVVCKDYKNEIICDSIHDGNGDGICQAGESCLIFDKNKNTYIGTDYLGKRIVNQFKKEQIIGVSI